MKRRGSSANWMIGYMLEFSKAIEISTEHYRQAEPFYIETLVTSEISIYQHTTCKSDRPCMHKQM